MSNVLIVDDQGTSRMIMEEVVRALDEVSAVHSFASPIDAPGPRCDFCGRPCGTYARWGTLSAERRRG